MLEFTDVNEAFYHFCQQFSTDHGWTVQDSRNGKVRRMYDPVLCAYSEPWNRVLFSPVRDANPFFHLAECYWMLEGCNDVKTLQHYNSRMADFSDNGRTFHGAYGHRWRHHWKIDQLSRLCTHLRRDPDSRRAVLQMWDPDTDLCSDSKDLPCNLCVIFETTPHPGAKLNMTVVNRSNDMVWGMLGANFVHFTFLQEVMAFELGIDPGQYCHFTTNLHVYEHHFNLLEQVMEEEKQLSPGSSLLPEARCIDHGIFDWKTSKFFNNVYMLMMEAWESHKRRDYPEALSILSSVQCPQWRAASVAWMQRRAQKWSTHQ